MADPQISVMMPAFNAEKYIGQAIESVLAQTYPHWELLIIDDGSTDETGTIAGSYRDDRIRLFQQENRGEAAARNLALSEAQGAQIAFLDADDSYLHDHLKLLLGFLQDNPGLDAVYTDGFYMDGTGRQMEKLSGQRRGPFSGDLYEEIVRASDVFGPPMCTMLRTQVIRRLGLEFDPRIIIGPDWDFLTRFAEHGSFGYLDRTTCMYRVHQTNITVTTGSELRRRSLAICREKVVQSGSFDRCSVSTRSYVFYDLLINLLYDDPARQSQVIKWPQFRALPRQEQARLYRLTASGALIRGMQSEIIGDWIQKAVELSSADIRNRLVAALYALNPDICRKFLRFRRRWSAQISSQSPFNIPS